MWHRDGCFHELSSQSIMTHRTTSGGKRQRLSWEQTISAAASALDSSEFLAQSDLSLEPNNEVYTQVIKILFDK